METKYVASLREDELEGILKTLTTQSTYRSGVAIVIYDRPDDNTAPAVEIWSDDSGLLIVRLEAVNVIVESTLINVITSRGGLLPIEQKALDAARADKTGRVVIRIVGKDNGFRITDITS